MASGERHSGHRAALGPDGGDPSGQLEGRKILHHSIAYHILNPDNAAAVNTGHRRPAPVRIAASADDLVNRRPQLMEWAIGKGYDRYSGRHRQTDSARREDLVGPAHPRRRRRDHRRLRARHLALSERPGADEAQLPGRLHGPQERHRRRSTFRRTRLRTPKASRCCGRTRSSPTSSRTSTCAARRCRSRRFCPTAARRSSATSTDFNFNWMTNYIYADDAAPAFPKGTIIHVTRVVRQHQGEQEQSGSRISGSATATARSTRWRTPG